MLLRPLSASLQSLLHQRRCFLLYTVCAKTSRAGPCIFVQDHTCLLCISLESLDIVIHFARKGLPFLHVSLVWFPIADTAPDGGSTY